MSDRPCYDMKRACPHGRYAAEQGLSQCRPCADDGSDQMQLFRRICQGNQSTLPSKLVNRGYYSLPLAEQSGFFRTAEQPCEAGYFCFNGQRVGEYACL